MAAVAVAGVRDFPKGAWRIREPAEGIFATIVSGRYAHDRRA